VLRGWEQEFRKKSGEMFMAQLSAQVLDVSGERIVLSTFVDITDRKRWERSMQAAKLAAENAQAIAESASTAKDHFIAVLSHELRTPLTPVLATVSMLLKDSRLDGDTMGNLDVIRRNVELEAMLIDDLLDVTRIEKGKLELAKRQVDLGTVVRHAAEVCSSDIAARRLEFGIDMGDGPYLVEADPVRLQQVFWNLLKNAIKFTPKGGCVGIRCRRDGEHHVIAEVNDSGAGIAPELLPRLFTAFEQGNRLTTRQFGGLGLGLAISKALAELHGGTLTASSQGKDKGATFALRLPLLPRREAHQPEDRPASATPKPASPLRILMVEDHGDTARIMKRLLSARRHQVELAGDVASGLQLALEGEFDLVLSDLGLPDGSGYDLIRSLRSKGLRMPAIALSGYGQEKDIQESRDAGFSAHLVKPVNPDRLMEAIARVTQHRAGWTPPPQS